MSAGNSTYSPLPQSNSDSDGSSEEELHISQGNRIVNRASKNQKSKSVKAENESKNNVINYKPLDNDGDFGVTLNKFQSNPDEVSILKPCGNIEIFSTSRKICFVFSLLLCVFTTVAFIWILPCNVGTCPSASNIKIYNFTWEETLSNLEIYGPSNLVSDQGRNYNLVFLTRNNLDFAIDYSESVMWCLKGKDGSLSWKIKLNKDPTDVDCKLIDVNADGLNDCLVYGINSLKAINSQTGTANTSLNWVLSVDVLLKKWASILESKHLYGKEMWDLQMPDKNKKKFYFKSFPLIIPDLDRDEINELLLLYSNAADDKQSHLGDSLKNYVIIISGKTGAIFYKPWQIKFCPTIHNLTFERNSTLSYICEDSDGKDSVEEIHLTEMYESVRNLSNEKMNLQNLETLSQHLPDLNTVYVNDFKLKLINQGNCPENCNVFVDIKDERERTGGETIYSKKKINTYGMKPVVLKTARENGFILKFWKWCSKKENSETQNDDDFSSKEIIIKNITRNIRKRSKKWNSLPYTSTVLDNEMLLESERELQRRKRTTGRVRKTAKSFLKSGNFNLHVICETIVKITLNDSYISFNKIAEDEIIQICKKPQICQPNVYQQRHSILVAQTGENDAKLITFTSKYVHEKEESKQNGEPWKLQSRISVSNL